MEEKLARIPFTRAEEHTIASMAGLMRVIGAVGIVIGILIVVVVVLGAGLLTAAYALAEASPRWADMGRAADAAGVWLYVAFGVGLLAAAVTLWQNQALYQAGGDFQLVARTDVADVDHLAHGLDRLRTYFKIQVLVVLVTVAVAFVTALSVVAVTRHAR